MRFLSLGLIELKQHYSKIRIIDSRLFTSFSEAIMSIQKQLTIIITSS